MDLANGETYILLDGEGKVVCLEDDKLIYKNLSEIKHISDAFTFWNCNLEDLERFINSFGTFKKDENLFKSLNLSEITFLEIKEEEDGSIIFC